MMFGYALRNTKLLKVCMYIFSGLFCILQFSPAPAYASPYCDCSLERDAAIGQRSPGPFPGVRFITTPRCDSLNYGLECRTRPTTPAATPTPTPTPTPPSGTPSAAPAPTPTESPVSAAGRVLDYATQGGRETYRMYEGDPLEYGGFQRSPILFDPLGNRRRRVYPSLSQTDEIGRPDIPELGIDNNDTSTATMHTLNLSVDDEIRKASMAVFQPVASIQGDFNNDQAARDRHLNLFTSLRGVALLTLSYLDKTVAAGLATVQQQTDMDTIQQQLKQLNWTNAKVANLHRGQVYNDVDEKFEACMVEKGRGGATEIDHINQSCGSCAGLYGSPFHFCTCCAEQSLVVNNTTSDAGASMDTGCGGEADVPCSEEPRAGAGANNLCAPGSTSLVGRVFYGLSVPGGTDGPVNQYTRYFREMYGDVCYEGSGSGSAAQRIKFRLPRLSVPQQINVLRDGPSDDVCGGSALYCPITMERLQYGICPAFRYVLNLVKDGNAFEEAYENRRDELVQYWVEASLGAPLNVSHYVSVSKMGVSSEVGQGLRQNRWVEVFCDSSSVAAYKRLHLRMMSIALDHLVMNRKITDQDRSQLRQLMNRVSDYLSFGQQDSISKVDEQLQALQVETDRLDEALRGATMAAAEAAQVRAQMFGEIINGFGGRLHP